MEAKFKNNLKVPHEQNGLEVNILKPVNITENIPIQKKVAIYTKEKKDINSLKNISVNHESIDFV